MWPEDVREYLTKGFEAQDSGQDVLACSSFFLLVFHRCHGVLSLLIESSNFTSAVSNSRLPDI